MTDRRPYDSPVRREAMAATRRRIVAAGVAIVRELASWDWSGLTFRAVAERAGVGERTVYRHFPNERALHAAVMAGLAEEAGVDYDALALDDVADTAARVFRSMSSLGAPPSVEVPLDDAFVAADRQRRDALLRAVAEGRPELDEAARLRLAAALDVLWSPTSHERLVHQWGLDAAAAGEVVAWMIEVLRTA